MAEAQVQAKIEMLPRREARGVRFLTAAALLAFCVIGLFPLYWMISNAFMPQTLTLQLPPAWFPVDPTLDNFRHLFTSMPTLRWMINTVFVSVSVTGGFAIIAPMAGYAIAKMDFPGKKVIFWMVIGSFMIPSQLVVIYLFTLVLRWGWIDTYYALIIPPLGHVFGLFLMKQYIQTIPSSLIDAARVDGCSEFGIFWRIVYPLAKPGVAVMSIFIFVQTWNGFFWPLVSTNSLDMRIIQVGLAIYRFTFGTRFASQMAGATIAALPIIIVFLALQRYFVRGLTVGGLKG